MDCLPIYRLADEFLGIITSIDKFVPVYRHVHIVAGNFTEGNQLHFSEVG